MLVFMEVISKKWWHSEKVRVKPISNGKKRNGGSGMHAKKCYWGFRSPLRRINEERKARAEAKRKPLEPRSVSQPSHSLRNMDQGFSKKKYIFKGYMSEGNDYVEVKPNPVFREPKFKNWVEQEIYRVKKTLN